MDSTAERILERISKHNLLAGLSAQRLKIILHLWFLQQVFGI